MRTAREHVKYYYFKTTGQEVADEQMDEVLSEESDDEEAKLILMCLFQMIKAAQKEAIEDCIDKISGNTLSELRKEYYKLIDELK